MISAVTAGAKSMLNLGGGKQNLLVWEIDDIDAALTGAEAKVKGVELVENDSIRLNQHHREGHERIRDKKTCPVHGEVEEAGHCEGLGNIS